MFFSFTKLIVVYSGIALSINGTHNYALKSGQNDLSNKETYFYCLPFGTALVWECIFDALKCCLGRQLMSADSQQYAYLAKNVSTRLGPQ